MSSRESRNIGILNLSSHEKYLIDLSKLVACRHDVTIFTTAAIEHRIRSELAPLSNVEWMLMQESDSKRDYLRLVEQETLESIDALIAFPFYGNIFDYLHYARFSPNCPYLQIAYEINGWSGKRPAFTPELYNFVKYPLKRKMLNRVDVLLVEYDTIRDYARDLIPRTKVETFTPVVWDEQNSSTAQGQNDDRVVVTIPGMIDQTRRDYEVVLEAVNILPREHADSIEIVFLGSSQGQYGERIIDRAVKLEQTGASVTYFRNWIPTETFETTLSRTDILVSPLRRTRQINGFVEEYGLSKGSGAISDAIRQSTPLLLPEWFDVPERVSPGIRTFDGAEGLAQIISKFISDEDALDGFEAGAKKISGEYTVEKQERRLARILG